jgi:hypothetical protein
VFGVAAPVHRELVNGEVDRVLEVILGEHLVEFVVVGEEALELLSAPQIGLVLENLAEAGEVDFVPELAAFSGGYLYTADSLPALAERYPSKLFSRSLAVT